MTAGSFTTLSDDSWLSLARVEVFKEKVFQYFPDTELNLIFNEESAKADFYIEDLSISTDDYSTVIDSGLLNEVAIFNPNIRDKINNALTVIIGSSIPGQTLMAINFLEKALPNLNNQAIDFDFKVINGNILERLNKLDAGEFDVIILSAADLNLLLTFELSKNVVQQILKHKKIMLLPLFDCPPAPGQGAIIITAEKDNLEAVEILDEIKNTHLNNAIKEALFFTEKQQEKDGMAFGAFHVETSKTAFNYGFGINRSGADYSTWDYKIELDKTSKKIFSSAAYMKNFFTYEYFDEIKLNEDCEAVFIASHKAIHSPEIKKAIEGKRVWAAGTKSWFQLAKQGIWVEGCSDGLGLEWLQPIFESALVQLPKEKITIITNKASAEEWKTEGWKAVASYELIPIFSQAIADDVASSDILFWTSFQQYEIYKNYCKPAAQHACPAGKTADLLMREGLLPVIFPTIKAFNDWIEKWN